MNRLKFIRRLKGMTQRELAEKIGRPQSYIAKIENGQVKLENINISNGTKIADALGCTLDDLVQ